MRKLILFIILLCCFCFTSAQHLPGTETVSEPSTFTHETDGDGVLFLPQTRELIQVSGAPTAYWTYYWEFGDGTFSKTKSPKHAYDKTGNYEVRLWATNHYDNGAVPSTRPQKVEVTQASGDRQDRASMTEALDLQRNREPMPSEEMLVVMSYKNTKTYTTSGRLYFFYNEHAFKDANFELLDTRTYHGERTESMDQFVSAGLLEEHETLFASNSKQLSMETAVIQEQEQQNLPMTLEESKMKYKDWKVLDFDTMRPSEERHVFFTMKTTAEMIKDTSAIISVKSVYVPERSYDNHTVKDMEMEIVTSHDPNKMASNASVMNYRLVRFKRFKYKIRFQNDGEGPASTIILETDIPEMFDKSSIEIIDQYPPVAICPKDKIVNYSCIDTVFTDRKAIFTFKNIYLPGTQQKNVVDMDSTKGFVKYAIKLKPDFHKQNTRSQTAIYFDKNEPVITNYATTRFLPGISIGAKAGYSISPSLDDHREYFIGATISPYKSFRGYFQAELFASASSYKTFENFRESFPVFQGSYGVYDISETQDYNNISLYAVPISYRYNFNNFLAVGAGVQLKMDLSSKATGFSNGEYSTYYEGEDDYQVRDETLDYSTKIDRSQSFTNFQTGVFVGLNAGFVRIGPSVGARYVYNFNEPHDQIQVYAIWKF